MINKHSGIHVITDTRPLSIWIPKSRKPYKLERDSINNSIPKQALYKKINNLIIIKQRIKINDIWAITYSYESQQEQDYRTLYKLLLIRF